MKREDRFDGFIKTIWQWFACHKRALPWRDLKIKDETSRGYRILVSEVMLQQTQVSRVIIVFRYFLERFPKISDLACASNRDVILAWRGMGYNSRALRLRDAAKIIVEKYRGKFPVEMEELRSIKGLGQYTAAAVRNFAFNLPTPCLDTNIRRILHRTFYGLENANETWKIGDRKLLTLAEEVLTVALDGKVVNGIPHDTRNWHAALMDFGSLVCTKRSPRCNVCPFAKHHLCKSAGRFRGRTDVPVYPERSRKVGRLRSSTKRPEPGRAIAGKFVPNRIIRGRIVEFLRDQPRGASFNVVGAQVCIDWDRKEHAAWLRGILGKLEREGILITRGKRYFLGD